MVSDILLFLITQLSGERQHKTNKMGKALWALQKDDAEDENCLQ